MVVESDMMNANVDQDKGRRLPADILGPMVIKLFRQKFYFEIPFGETTATTNSPAFWTICRRKRASYPTPC